MARLENPNPICHLYSGFELHIHTLIPNSILSNSHFSMALPASEGPDALLSLKIDSLDGAHGARGFEATILVSYPLLAEFEF